MNFFYKYCLLFCCLGWSTLGNAQNSTVLEYNLNKKYPEAQYKFSFVHITDVHIGEDVDDYGTPGYFNDTMPAEDNSKPVVRLKKAVQWINDHIDSKNIKFVVISGDLTGSAEKSEYQMCKKILDDLKVPYVPIIGNHDIWPYVRYQDEAPYACGDSILNEVFADAFERNKHFFQNWNDGTRLSRTYNPETGLEHYFQNYSFEYDGFVFYGLDFNPRYHVKKAEPGIGPEARLMDWAGGTYRWLKEELKNNPNKKKHNVCFIAHHPVTDNLLFIISGFVFDWQDYVKLTDMLAPYKENLGLWMAGHIHIDYDYELTNNIMHVRGVAANKDFDSSRFEIVNVYEIPDVSTAVLNTTNKGRVDIFPNPNDGKFTIIEKSLKKEAVLRMYDLSGGLIFEMPIKDFLHNQESIQMDLSKLPKGLYHLTISDNEHTLSQQVILQ
ncbi:MAG: hypothetical protein RJA25_2596 [Bacteroidota bacterium]|jgi:predicted MPP superfamily phosphohydrolase